MTHLGHDELIALAEETASTHPHLALCDACRTRVEEFRQVLSRARSVDVPEPSPLFWDHFSQRVHSAVASEAHEPARMRFARGWWPALAGALAIVIIGFAVTMRSGRPQIGPSQAAVPPAAAEQAVATVTDVPVAADPQDQAADDQTWAFMSDLTSQIDWEHVEEAGMMPQPGSADLVLQEMTADEQRSLLELLQQEMRNAKQL